MQVDRLQQPVKPVAPLPTSAARLLPAHLAVVVLIIVAGIAYALIAHRLTIDADRSALGYGFAIGSAGLLIVAMGWPTRWRWPLIGALVVALIFGWHSRATLLREFDPRWFYLFQHAGVQALLGALFGLTLRKGRQSLITTLALRVHHHLPVELLTYTRQVTVAWTSFFAVMTTLSLGLWFFAPPSWWSLMANFLTTPAAIAMFVAEYRLRLKRFPDFEHAPLLEGLRAFNRRAE